MTQTLNVNTLIPDGIEPVEALRCWLFVNDKLYSINGTEWTPGQPLVAECQQGAGVQYRWVLAKRGMSREKAHEIAHTRNQTTMIYFTARSGASAYNQFPYPPKTEPPDGYGFKLETIKHDAPHEQCTCGIYAATTKHQLPPSGQVYGKVKLWGKIIPGEKGYRAQYAYPSEFHVPPELEHNPTLKAFGVPIIVKTPPAQITSNMVTFIDTTRTSTHWPNLTMLFLR